MEKEENKLRYNFLCISNNESSEQNYQSNWIPYDNENQVLLNQKYELFRLNKESNTVNLLGQYEDSTVDFSNLIQISRLNNQSIKIKIEENILIEDNEDEYLYFWNSNKNLIDNEQLNWTPYDLEDQVILKVAYLKYKNDNLNNNKIDLKSLTDHYVDFSSMLQISRNDLSNVIPIQRCHPNLVSNIIRTNRFRISHNNSDQTQLNILKEHQLDKDNIFIESIKHLDNSKKMYCIYFNVFDSKISIEIESNLCFFKNNYVIKLSLEEMKNILIQEITDLGKTSQGVDKSIDEYIKEINLINGEQDFFIKIIRIFTTEGFLYRRLNEFLRYESKVDLQLIKYYYTCLLFSFSYFSKFASERYSKITEDLTVYRVSSLSETELEIYNKNEIKFRIFYDFISTTYDKEKAIKFLHQEDQSCKQYLWEIKIPLSLIQYEPFNFCEISDYSQFRNEKEVLLISGAVLSIDNIIPYTEIIDNKVITFPNTYIIICTLKSYSLSSLKTIFKFNNSITTLDLHLNSFGENVKNMLYLKEALEMNNSITTLHLHLNSFGENEKAMIYLKQALLKNHSISTLNLSNNSIGKNEKNMLYLKEALLNNNSITSLSIASNSIGSNEKNVFYLKELLEKNNSIKILDFSYNSIGWEKNNMLYLKEALEQNNSITNLKISSNSIGKSEKDIIYLKEALEKNNSITILDIGYNLIGKCEKDLIYLKEAFEKNSSITTLDLSRNSIGWKENNMLYLKEALEKNSTITNLCLYLNSIGSNEKDLLYLKEALEKNNSITRLDLTKNSLSENDKKMLIEQFDKIEILFDSQ